MYELRIKNYVMEKEFKIFFPIVIYIFGLATFLWTLVPFFDSLIPKKIPEEVIRQIGNINYLVFFSALFVLLFSLFFESYVLFLVGSFLGAKLKYKEFFKLFVFANIPIALKFITIALKNLVIEVPSPYLVFTNDNNLLGILDLFNIGYLYLLLYLLLYRSSLNKFSLSVFIFIAFLYRILF